MHTTDRASLISLSSNKSCLRGMPFMIHPELSVHLVAFINLPLCDSYFLVNMLLSELCYDLAVSSFFL